MGGVVPTAKWTFHEEQHAHGGRHVGLGWGLDRTEAAPKSNKTRGGSLASSSVWKPGSPTRSPRLPLTGSSVGSGFVLIAGGLALFIIVSICHSRHEVQIEDSDDDPLSSQIINTLLHTPTNYTNTYSLLLLTTLTPTPPLFKYSSRISWEEVLHDCIPIISSSIYIGRITLESRVV